MSIKVHGVVVGPHQTPDEEDDEVWTMVVTAEVNKEVYYDFALSSDSLDWLYSIEKWCGSHTEPFVIEE